MRYADPNITSLAVLMVILAIPMLIGGIIMLQPRHSAQAQPRLTALTAPELPDELNRLHREKQTTYQDRQDPRMAECFPETADTDAEAATERYHVTVAEGDRQKMTDLIRYSAGIHDSRITPHYRGVIIEYHDRWKDRLAALNPYYEPQPYQPTENYIRWAEHAASAKPDRPAPPTPCAPLPHRIHLIVTEQTVGAMSDRAAKESGWMLIAMAPVLMLLGAIMYATAPPSF